MSKTGLGTAGLRAALEELRRAGCPVDLAVADQIVEKGKVQIEQVGGVADSMVREMEDGRMAVMAEIAVTNQTSRPIEVINIDLEAPWGDSSWQWLGPTQTKFRNQKRRRCSFPEYVIPGQFGWRFPYEEVINHVLLDSGRLSAKHRLVGWLLGVGGRMPAELRHGQWLDFSLTIITSDYTEYAETIKLWTDRLETPPKAVAPRKGLTENTAPTGAVVSNEGTAG